MKRNTENDKRRKKEEENRGKLIKDKNERGEREEIEEEVLN